MMKRFTIILSALGVLCGSCAAAAVPKSNIVFILAKAS